MRVENKYGNMVFEDDTIQKETIYHFSSLTELLNFRETMDEKHVVVFPNLTIQLMEYVPFERHMIEGDEEE